VLINEINHRVKNSLQLVASLFSLQASASDDPKVSQNLQEAVGRVGAVARIHERLYRSPDVATVDLAAYVRDICTDLAALAPHCDIVCQTEGAIQTATDRAVRVALLTTELVTNAAKHGGPGQIVVGLTGSEPTVALTVRDEGSGLPNNFNVGGAQTLGMKIIRALVEQMGAKLTAKSAQPGTEFVIDIPKNPS
jgi:two-component sensor histidine kinase